MRSFPRHVVLAAACLEVLAQRAAAQQVPDTTFDTRIASPAWPEGRGPRLVIDEAHFEFHTASGRYRPFADLARHDGLRVAPGTRRFTAAVLESVDVLVIANALGAPNMADSAAERPAFAADEIAAVEAWVRAGGSLLLIADHSPMGAAASGLARAFGVDMRNAYCIDEAAGGRTPSIIPFTVGHGLDTTHVIVRGRNDTERVRNVTTFTGQSLSGPPGASQLMTLSPGARDQMISFRDRQAGIAPRPEQMLDAGGRAQGLAFEHGRGRVVVLGEAAMMTAQRAGPNGSFAMGMNVPGNDDRQFAINVLNWLGRAMR